MASISDFATSENGLTRTVASAGGAAFAGNIGDSGGAGSGAGNLVTSGTGTPALGGTNARRASVFLT